MNKVKIQEKLKNLKSKKDVQDLFIDLNFDYSKDDDFNWLDNLITSNLKEKIDFINIINEYKTFNIFYCKLKIDNLYRSRALQREIAKKIAHESDCLIVFANQNENVSRIVYADVLSSTTSKLQQQNQTKTSLKLSGYTISKDEKLRTASEQLIKIEIKDDIAILDLISSIKKAFKIEPVTDEFFKIIKSYIGKLTEDYKSYFPNKQKTKAFALQFFNRLLFLKYIEKKKWLNGNINYLSELIEKFKASTQNQDSNKNIYEDLLKPLLFFAFSKNNRYFPASLTKDLINEFKNLPYLNGGLFEENELDIESLKIPDATISGIFKDILDKYNFTVTEDTPFDREIAIDPEMLGLIYESIVNEEERSGSGIFYTPRVEVDFMCKKSLLHYFCSNTQITQDKLIDLIFGESTEPEGTSPAGSLSFEEKNKILSELYELNVLDPACGSGAFLIGMLQNILGIIVKVDELDLEELYRTEPDYLYNRKKELIEKIIHGVDIKPWAAQLAELRLWLYLIWDFETSIENLTKKPLLPSLEFKIRQGDSLLSEIEGNPIILRNIGENYLFPDIYTKVHHIIDLKEKYYQHEDDTITKKQIENAEKELIAHILNRKRMALSKKLGGTYGEGKAAEPQHLFEITEQQKLDFKLAVEKIKKEQDEIEAEIDRIDNLIRNLANIKEKNYFIWEIDFAEIFFAKGGFDIIIGNPPYVRQEEIAPPLVEKEKITIDIKRDYKERLINNIISINGKDKISKFDRKADYYVYFYFVCLSLLKTNGIFTFINSTSWLDVGYGTFLQEFLLKNFRIIDIHDNQVKRSFKSADINTLIISIEKPKSGYDVLDNLVKFVNHRVSFEESININSIKDIYLSGVLIKNYYFRLHPKKQIDLLDEGIEKEKDTFNINILNSRYVGSKWGCRYLRAPDIYFICQEKQKSCEIILSSLFIGERYLNTGGADGFFILTDVQEFDDEYFIIRNLSKEGKEDGSPLFKIKRQFLKLLVKDITKTEKKIIIEKADAWVLNINTENVDNETKKYIKWGEKVGFNKRSVTRIQEPWYKPTRQMKKSGKILFPRSFNENYLIYFNPNEFIALRFYRLYPKREIDLIAILAILNSTYFGMLMELNGPSNLGLGVLDVTMDSFLRITVPYDEKYNNKLHDAFRKISIRSIGSIYKEIGINPKQPIRSQKLKPLPDRKALDDIVFDILDLSQKERDEVYWAICELVQNRLQKATSFI